MQRVLMISGSLPPMKCGVGHYTSTLLRSMVKKPIRLSVLTSANLQSSNPNIRTYTTPGWRLRDLPGIIRCCKHADVDIIHIQYPTVGYGRQLGINLLPLLLRLLVRKPHTVITLHEYFSSPLLGRIRNLITILFAQTIIVSNYADKNALPRVANKKAILIPIGSGIEEISPETEATTPPVKDIKEGKMILFFGFAFPSKQLELLIKALKSLPDNQLIIASDLNSEDNYHQRLLEMINTNNSRAGFDQIRVIGFQPPHILRSLLQQSLCFVLPQASPLNPKSSTIVAAIRYAIPVIGKLGEAYENAPFVNNQNSLLLETVSSESISQAISRLADKEFRDMLSMNLAKISGDYSWGVIVDKHLRLYESFLSNHGTELHS